MRPTGSKVRLRSGCYTLGRLYFCHWRVASSSWSHSTGRRVLGSTHGCEVHVQRSLPHFSPLPLFLNVLLWFPNFLNKLDRKAENMLHEKNVCTCIQSSLSVVQSGPAWGVVSLQMVWIFFSDSKLTLTQTTRNYLKCHTEETGFFLITYTDTWITILLAINCMCVYVDVKLPWQKSC